MVDASVDVTGRPSLPLPEEATARSWVQHYRGRSLDVVEGMLRDETVKAVPVSALLVAVVVPLVYLCDAF